MITTIFILCWVLPSLIGALMLFHVVRLEGDTPEDERERFPAMLAATIWPISWVFWVITLGEQLVVTWYPKYLSKYVEFLLKERKVWKRST